MARKMPNVSLGRQNPFAVMRAKIAKNSTSTYRAAAQASTEASTLHTGSSNARSESENTMSGMAHSYRNEKLIRLVWAMANTAMSPATTPPAI